jgi:hypothetical protein
VPSFSSRQSSVTQNVRATGGGKGDCDVEAYSRETIAPGESELARLQSRRSPLGIASCPADGGGRRLDVFMTEGLTDSRPIRPSVVLGSSRRPIMMCSLSPWQMSGSKILKGRSAAMTGEASPLLTHSNFAQ